MKTFRILFVLLAVCVVSANAQGKKKKTDTVCFEVNLSCQNCQKKIEKNISWEKGVKDLKVDLKEKTVRIEYDTKKTSPERLKEAIEKLDFTCKTKEKSE